MGPSFLTAGEVGIRREGVVWITTGSKVVDAMIGGEYGVRRMLA